MSPAARLNMIKGPYTFIARGLTAILDRSDQVRRLMGLFGILQQMPNLGQAVYEKYDLSKVPDLLIESFGFDAKDLGHGERPQEQVQMARAEREAAEAQGYSQEVDPEGATRDTPEDKMMQKEEEEGGAGCPRNLYQLYGRSSIINSILIDGEHSSQRRRSHY